MEAQVKKLKRQVRDLKRQVKEYEYQERRMNIIRELDLEYYLVSRRSFRADEIIETIKKKNYIKAIVSMMLKVDELNELLISQEVPFGDIVRTLNEFVEEGEKEQDEIVYRDYRER